MTDSDDSEASSSIRVLIFSSGFPPGFRSGGPTRSIVHIIGDASSRFRVSVITADRDVGETAPYEGMSGSWTELHNARAFYLNPARLAQWRRLRRDLGAVSWRFVYLNSLWSPVYTVLPLVLFRLRLIHSGFVLIAPRGELSPGALSLKTRKKRLVLPVLKTLLRGRRVVWHASTGRERDEIGAVFPEARIVISQDPTGLSRSPMPPQQSDDRLKLVYISRISPMKNLLAALEALRRVKSPMTFDIYGPIEDLEYWSKCEDLLPGMPAHVGVKYRGIVHPDDVVQVFNRYDAFVLPTLGENFGHVVAESLSASCPVICSQRTPWTQTLRQGGGWALEDPAPIEIAGLLDRLAAMDAAERLATRESAGSAYARWRLETELEPHVFDLALEVAVSAHSEFSRTCLPE